MTTFSELVPIPDLLMGVKAVWGLSRARVQCFGARGDRNDTDRYFQIPRSVAERARDQPFFVTLGGGAHVDPALDGRVLEVIRPSSVFGETQAFVSDVALLDQLRQWPVAIAIHDIYQIADLPLFVDDLGFKDRSILANAFDNVIRPKAQIAELWQALSDRDVKLQDVPPLAHFRDPLKAALVSTRLPHKISADEGRRLYKESWELELKSKLAAVAKEENRKRNGGRYTCEACSFNDDVRGMFDAHHLVPLSLGQRTTVASDFAVLCPTCHRIAHCKADNMHDPLEIREIRKILASHGAVFG